MCLSYAFVSQCMCVLVLLFLLLYAILVTILVSSRYKWRLLKFPGVYTYYMLSCPAILTTAKLTATSACAESSCTRPLNRVVDCGLPGCGNSWVEVVWSV